MSTKKLPCFTVICDICGSDAMEGDDYAGYGDPGVVQDIARDGDWLILPGLDICEEHRTGWASDDGCASCGFDADDQLYLGNCGECWEKAMALPRGRCGLTEERCSARTDEYHFGCQCNDHVGHKGQHLCQQSGQRFGDAS